jgi:hypothetical protein
MADYMKLPLPDLLKEITADGVVDQQEVQQLRERIFADNMVDQAEADFLFELNDLVSGKPNHPSWADFFIEAMTRFILEDLKSPGVVDEDETQWLIGHIQKDGSIDDIEIRLLRALKVQAKSLSQSLKSKIVEWKV